MARVLRPVLSLLPAVLVACASAGPPGADAAGPEASPVRAEAAMSSGQTAASDPVNQAGSSAGSPGEAAQSETPAPVAPTRDGAAAAAPAEAPSDPGNPAVEAPAAGLEGLAGPSPEVRPTPRIPETVRVGLSTDQDSIVLPCCQGDLVAMVGSRELVSVRPIVVTPGVERTGSSVFMLQIAALRDPQQADELATRVAGRLGVPTGVVFDARTGLYRVRAGRYSSREDAEGARRLFGQHNFHDLWVTSEQEPFEEGALKVQQGERAWLVHSRWLRIRPAAGETVAFGGSRYRGELLIYLNDRGSLNLINEVSPDEYLRGVVPREMGPNVFDDLDALKAQAVAARTYALRNLGEFAGEGFDICATPRCQVYGGYDAEHELSDRAVTETSGEVLLYDGRFADALYSSTCGGHTEDVEIVFPLKSEQYLRGVPCLEAGVDRLGGLDSARTPIEAGLASRVVPADREAGAAADFARRVKKLTRMAGYVVTDDPLADLDRRTVQEFLSRQLGLDLDASLFVASADLPYLVGDAPQHWSDQDLRLAAYLARANILNGSLAEPVPSEALDHALFHLAVFLRVLEPFEARYLELGDGEIALRHNQEVIRLPLADEVLTFRQWGERVESAQLALLPGDRVTAYRYSDRVIGLRHQVDSDGVAYDRTSNMSSWTRFRSDAELARRVGERYPGLEFADLEILERGVSGRVSRVRVVGRDGDSVEIQGLPVRWTFDVPDTLFTARRLAPEDGEPGWLFTGRGWGHGVGMCQVGAYGMAVRGHGYRDILGHYYRGVHLERLGAAPRAARTVDGGGPEVARAAQERASGADRKR